MKINYFAIPLITVLVSFAGSLFTSSGIQSGWYDSILKPSWTPAGSAIGAVWTVLFILATISALIFWNKAPRNSRFWWIVAIFLLNAFLNVFWSYLFFSVHLIDLAVLEAVVLGASVIALIGLIWPFSRLAALLLVPYVAWVSFAAYLNYTIWTLNR